MRYFLAPALAALTLAACGGGSPGDADAEGTGNVSAEEAVSKAKAEGIMPEPGQYKATITMTGIDLPGVPAGHGGGMTTTTDYCLTEEEVTKGFEEMIKRGQDGECSYENFSLKDGKMDAVMNCKSAEGGARMTMAGTVTPTSSEITASSAIDMGEAGKGTMNFTVKHERTGDCPAP